jgi:cobaltochelatase CobS
VNPEEVKAIAKNAVDQRVGEVLASMAELVSDEVAKAVRTVEVKIAGLPEVKIDKAHKCFERVLRYAANRKSVLLVGPAGSGKTTLAEQVAKALGLPFYMSGKCADEVKITGYMDGGGTYRTTAFRKAWEFGGVFLFDEMDGWTADALIAVNAPLAGQWGDFPDGMVARHPDFVAIGAANTYGRGADRQYVGREQLDAATLDRFAVLPVEYDEELELALASNRKWAEFCQKVRAACEGEKVRHIVSPRASIEGSIMLAAGEPRADVEEAYVWKGLDEPTRNRVKAAMR